jgi:glycosyltransferase involved in cell wall biosynthesis
LLTVYHCVDPLIEVYQTRHGLISEDIVVKNVDLVICTSKELRNKKLKLNPNTHLIPNAANINHSQKALDPELPVAAVLLGIGKPIIGYFGNIERRVNYNLLKELLDQNPDKNFAFVGPVDNNYADMSVFERPNAFLTGAVPYEQMPAVLKGFDVAIIPFKKDEVSSSIFPLKLFEYLGSGKPTVSSNFNTDLKDFTKDTVAYCKTAEEFTIAINDALNDTPELQKKRLAVAAENTWEHRVIEIEKLLALNLELKLKAINQ